MKALRQRHGLTFIEFLMVITIFSIVAAILLPVLARARQAALRTHCMNNMRQLGLIFRMFADTNRGVYPPGAPNAPWGEAPAVGDARRLVRNNFICDPSALFPDYVDNFNVFHCRASERPKSDPNAPWFTDVTFTRDRIHPAVAADPRNAEALSRLLGEGARPDPECLTNQMYTYLPYAVITQAQGVFLWNELHRRMRAGEIDFMKDDLLVPGGHGPGGGDIFYRVRDGVTRFFQVDADDPARNAIAEKDIPVLYDSVAADNGAPFVNHIWPLGGNVLYMDGHAEFRRLPSVAPEIPYSQEMMEWTRRNVYDNTPLLNAPPWCSNRPTGVPFEPRYRYYPHDPRYLGLIF
ncbi:MAG TPA: prepilin-type N-terminal cleavage/methylation domain-containing protein [Candidatus Hydrogenedentes bacterium]|nr:prepilin-type N-terminal cleavage/methylation domain-containing protein [Candidatus Hydrogenedentota bacterium]HOS01524.1 prepilin-type N-terminal cleavage/methylation domain-containing protein [Candidatus Hydrogenedentota bacterium]